MTLAYKGSLLLSLRLCLPHQRAEEIAKFDLKVAYYCRLYAVEFVRAAVNCEPFTVTDHIVLSAGLSV